MIGEPSSLGTPPTATQSATAVISTKHRRSTRNSARIRRILGEGLWESEPSLCRASQEFEGLVGVGIHVELARDLTEQSAIGIDHESCASTL